MSKLCNVFNIVKASISLVILFIAIPNTYANDKDIDTLGVLYSCDIKYCNAEVCKVICYQIDKSSIDDDRLNWVEQVNVPMDRFKLMNNSNDVDGICNVISLSTKMGNGFLKLGDSDKGRNCEKVSYTFAYDESKRVIKYAYMNFNINLV